MAKEDFDLWFPEGCGFLIDTGNASKRGDFRRGDFYLHQATESFYNAILLVFSGYQWHSVKLSIPLSYDKMSTYP